ncbi:MAG TPA: ATPase, T2SS/T4P/T4SS family [Noviherbaspirillum sp.]|nr:ATPase, T2SS/T4P/T4SS family [Noviherbaspirillum sp.]
MKQLLSRFASRFAAHRAKDDRVRYPYNLTGDDYATITLLPAYRAHVIVRAVAKGRAVMYVTEDFLHQYSSVYKQLEKKLALMGWETKVETESGAVIRSYYGNETLDHTEHSVGRSESENTAHFDSLLRAAIKRNAAEIKFHVRSESCAIVFNIDGLIYPYESIEKQQGIDILSNIFTNLSESTSFERGKETFSMLVDQSCMTKVRTIDNAQYKCRYQSLPEADGGMDVNLRILPQGQKGEVPSLEKLKHVPSAIALLRRATARPLGAVIATGPVGSGKTSTLFALLYRKKDERDEYVLTFEDPVEYFQFGVTRVPVGKIGYVQAVSTTLRMGAHRVLIGEVRTKEMGGLVKVLQETGQKVFTTLHVNGANRVIDRLTGDEIGLPRQSICDRDMIAVMFYQRLLPMLCSCSLPATPERLGPRLMTELIRLEIPLSRVRVHKPGGCNHPHCNNGRRGRVPVVEAIEPDDQYMAYMRRGQDGEARDYWLSTCKSGLLDEDVVGKPLIANAIYRMAQGEIDPVDLERVIDRLETYTPHPNMLKGKPGSRTSREMEVIE